MTQAVAMAADQAVAAVAVVVVAGVAVAETYPPRRCSAKKSQLTKCLLYRINILQHIAGIKTGTIDVVKLNHLIAIFR